MAKVAKKKKVTAKKAVTSVQPKSIKRRNGVVTIGSKASLGSRVET